MLYRYKPEEGRNVRQATFWLGLGLISYGCYAFSLFLGRWQVLREPLFPRITDPNAPARSSGFEKVPILGLSVTGANLLAIALVVTAILVWVRFLARAKVADHLIEVEGEMKKVTWPSFREASNSSIVVITTVLLLMGYLALADWAQAGIFQLILWDRLPS